MNIILGILLIHYITYFMFGRKSNVLCCGIFGHCTISPNKINAANVKILGMFNESRGRNSCGVTYDGEIYYGVDGDKLWTDFIKGRKFENKVFPHMFGHTRQSSVGIINKFNAHPFGFGDNKRGDGYKLIGVHNGTLLNYKELAAAYEVDLEAEYITDTGGTATRQKIDSEILFEIIFKTGHLHVLNEYNGRAALAWVDTDQPNVMYLWSGKSKPWASSPEDRADEERPLNVYIENKNSFYFSSLPEALYAIGGDSDNVFQIEYNTVYIVTNGNFKGAKQIRVSRKNNYHLESYTNRATVEDYPRGGSRITARNSAFNLNHGHGHHHAAYGYGYGEDEIEDPDVDFTGGASAGVAQRSTKVLHLPAGGNFSKRKPLKKEDKTLTNIHYDSLTKDRNAFGEKIYVQKFRYWRNGHPITGIYCDLPGHGLYYLGETIKGAMTFAEKLYGKEFVDGRFNLQDVPTGKGKIYFVNPNKPIELLYFLEGMMMSEPLDYSALLGKTASLRHAQSMSYCTKHPVVDIYRKRDFKGTHQGIYKDGKLFTGEVDGLYFDKVYLVKSGNLEYATEKVKSLVDSYFEEKASKTPMYDTLTDFGKQMMIESMRAEAQDKPELGSPRSIESSRCSVLAAAYNGSNESIEKPAVGRKEPFCPTVFNHCKNFITRFERDKIEDEQKTHKVEEVKQNENIEDTNSDYDEIVEALVNEHFTPAMILLEECKAKLKKYPDHSGAKEAIRVVDSFSKILEEYIKE